MAGLQRLLDRRTAAALVAFAGAATVGAALVFQHGFGYLPCKLCLQQRWPYYIAVPLALVVAFAPLPRFWGRVALSLVGLIFLAGAGLGVFHAGVEWGWWPGPNDCGGAPTTPAGGMGDFLKQLEATRVVSCTEAAWRLFGLSMAGWNALISLGLALVALFASRGIQEAAPIGGAPAAREPSR